MKPYPAYKASGVEWLGDVPEGWQVIPLKRRFSVRLGKMLQPASRATDDFKAPYLRAANIQWSGVDFSDLKTMWFNKAEAEALTLERGDLLVSEGGDVGRSAILEVNLGEVYFQNSLNRVRSQVSDCTRFLFYWMSAIKARGYVDVLCNKSTITHFTAEKVKEVPVPFPSLPEQRAIAAFLDHETAKIDGLIEEQRRLIALLAEKRQATISHAVTKGLNPNAKLKPSGIDWLGDVPEGWEVVRLGSLFDDVAEPGSDGLPILSVSIHSGVSNEAIADEDMDRKVSRSEDRSKYIVVRPGDLTYNMMRAWQGGFGAVQVLGMVSPAYVVARPRAPNRQKTEFIELLLRTPNAVTEMKRHSRGVTDFRLRLYWGEFKTIRVAVPAVAEQQAILSRIFQEVDRLDALNEATSTAITLLQERRAALISAAVTGKIDVRGLAPSDDALKKMESA